MYLPSAGGNHGQYGSYGSPGMAQGLAYTDLPAKISPEAQVSFAPTLLDK